jgi:hypothetical protein
MNKKTALIPIEQAAAQLTTTTLNVLMHLKRGMLAGVETTDGWEVTADSLSSLLRQRSEGAAPLICKSNCGKARGCGPCAD